MRLILEAKVTIPNTQVLRTDKKDSARLQKKIKGKKSEMYSYKRKCNWSFDLAPNEHANSNHTEIPFLNLSNYQSPSLTTRPVRRLWGTS